MEAVPYTHGLQPDGSPDRVGISKWRRWEDRVRNEALSLKKDEKKKQVDLTPVPSPSLYLGEGEGKGRGKIL